MSAIYEDLNLREEYRGLFINRCEIWPHLSEVDQETCVRLGCDGYGNIIHHIFHNIGRIDEWSNLISMNHVVHYCWGHALYSKEMTVASLYAKWLKSTEKPSLKNPYPKSEFDREELRKCYGQCVVSWIERQEYEVRLSDHYKDLCLEMRESF